MSLLLITRVRSQFQEPPDTSPILLSTAVVGLTVVEGDVTPRTFDVEIQAPTGFPALTGVAVGTPSQSWMTVAFVSGTTWRVTITGTGTQHALATATATVTATNGTAPVTLTGQLTETAAPAPVVAISGAPTNLNFSATEGSSTVLPTTVTRAITNSGTGSLTGLNAVIAYGAGASGYLTPTFDTTTAPASMTITPNGAAIGALQDGAYTYSITVDGDNPATAAVVSGTLTVAPVGTLAYAAPAYPLPTGMGYDTATGLPTGNVVPLADQLQNRLPPVYINMDTQPDSLGRVMSAANTPVVNTSIFQRWLNDDATGAVWTGGPVGDVAGVPRKRGYSCATTRQLEGGLLWPHITTSETWYRHFKPLGYIYDPNLETPPALNAVLPTFTTTVNNQTCFGTSRSGQSPGAHGNWAMTGFHCKMGPLTGPSIVGAFNLAIVQVGSINTDQTQLAQIPHHITLHDFTVQGARGRYCRRGVQPEVNYFTMRAFHITEIHNSYMNAGTILLGLRQDAQCLAAWTFAGPWDIRFGIMNGGDECMNMSGSESMISAANGLVNMTDLFFGWLEMCHDDDFLFGTWAGNAVDPGAGPNGPYNFTSGTEFFWHAKNHFEVKQGERIWLFGARMYGLRTPNDNQGLAITIKANPYGGSWTWPNFVPGKSPLQFTGDVNITCCWIDSCPGAIGMLINEHDPVTFDMGLGLRNVCIEDVMCWNLNEAPYNQDSKTRFVYVAGGRNKRHLTMPGLVVRHCSCLMTNGGGTFGTPAIWMEYRDTVGAPNMNPDAQYNPTGYPPVVAGPPEPLMVTPIFEDCLIPYCSNGVVTGTSNNAGTKGIAGMNLACGTNSYTFRRMTFVPKTGGVPSSGSETYAGLSGLTAETSMAALGVVDYTAGNLRLSPSSTYYAGNANGAPNGHNRGVRNPDQLYAQMARIPSLFASGAHPTVP